MDVKQPIGWNIKVTKEDGMWYEHYVEYFAKNDENIKALEYTIPILETTLKMAGFENVNIRFNIREDPIFLIVDLKADNLEAIADQIISEFALISNIGSITLRDILMVAIQAIALKGGLEAREKLKTEIKTD